MVVQILCSHQLLLELWVKGCALILTASFMPGLEARRYLSSAPLSLFCVWKWSELIFGLGSIENNPIFTHFTTGFSVSRGSLEPMRYPLAIWHSHRKWPISHEISHENLLFIGGFYMAMLSKQTVSLGWSVSTGSRLKLRLAKPGLRLKLCTAGAMPRFVSAWRHPISWCGL